MGNVRFSRYWSMPNSETFKIKPIQNLIERYIEQEKRGSKKLCIIDPFARNAKYGTITNDLNTKFDCTYHLDAIDFLKLMPNECADIVFYDPPYSLRQVKECYEGVGIKVTQEHTKASWRARHLDEITRITKPNGLVISLGWNSNGVGKKRGFTQIEVMLVAHGGSKHDTIVTVERKMN